MNNQVRGSTVFCIPGKHPVDAMTKWVLVRASVNTAGEWFEDPNSPASIPVCTSHSLKAHP